MRWVNEVDEVVSVLGNGEEGPDIDVGPSTISDGINKVGKLQVFGIPDRCDEAMNCEVLPQWRGD